MDKFTNTEIYTGMLLTDWLVGFTLEQNNSGGGGGDSEVKMGANKLK